MERRVFVKDLKPGDLVDLEGDPYADPDWDDQMAPYEYATVDLLDFETDECVCVYFQDRDACGFPPDHLVTVHALEESVFQLVTDAEAEGYRRLDSGGRFIKLALPNATSDGRCSILFVIRVNDAGGFDGGRRFHGHRGVSRYDALESLRADMPRVGE